MLKKELKEKDIEIAKQKDLIEKLRKALKNANIDFLEDIDEKNDEEKNKDKDKKNEK